MSAARPAVLPALRLFTRLIARSARLGGWPGTLHSPPRGLSSIVIILNLSRPWRLAATATWLVALGIFLFAGTGETGAEDTVDLSGGWTLVLDHPLLPGSFNCIAYVDQHMLRLAVVLDCVESNLLSKQPVLRGSIDESTGNFSLTANPDPVTSLTFTGHTEGDDGVTGSWEYMGLEGSGSFAGQRSALPPWGDADCSRVIDSRDAQLVMQTYSYYGIFNQTPWCYRADADLDCLLGSTDATLILDYVAGYISHLPWSSPPPPSWINRFADNCFYVGANR